jgi:hypothetical protein
MKVEYSCWRLTQRPLPMQQHRMFSTHAFRFVTSNGDGMWGRLIWQRLKFRVICPVVSTVFLLYSGHLPDVPYVDFQSRGAG